MVLLGMIAHLRVLQTFFSALKKIYMFLSMEPLETAFVGMGVRPMVCAFDTLA